MRDAVRTFHPYDQGTAIGRMILWSWLQIAWHSDRTASCNRITSRVRQGVRLPRSVMAQPRLVRQKDLADAWAYLRQRPGDLEPVIVSDLL